MLLDKSKGLHSAICHTPSEVYMKYTRFDNIEVNPEWSFPDVRSTEQCIMLERQNIHKTCFYPYKQEIIWQI